MRQVELAGLTSEAVFAGIKISFSGLIGSERQLAAARVMLVSVLGGESSAGKS